MTSGGSLPRLFLTISDLEKGRLDGHDYRIRRTGLRQRAGGEQRTGLGLGLVSHVT